MFNPHGPWVFQRDELDLLEDELEYLHQVFEVQGKLTKTLESRVLDEYNQTEEASEQALAERLGLTPLEAVVDEFCDEDTFEPEDAFSLRDVVSGMRQHPLYQQARVWCKKMRSYAQAAYQQEFQQQNAFRLYLNAHAVPVKVHTGLCEEALEDLVGLEVAREEFQLALVYVERMLASLNHLVKSLDDYHKVSRAHHEGEELRALLIGAIAEVKRKIQRL